MQCCERREQVNTTQTRLRSEEELKYENGFHEGQFPGFAAEVSKLKLELLFSMTKMAALTTYM